MLSVLAKLSIIKFSNFGLECFNILKDLVQSGRDMETQVIQVIKQEVITRMKQRDPTTIPVSLIQGLNQLIDETENSSMLTGLYDMCFPVWLRVYSKKIDVHKKHGTTMDNHEHFDAIIALISVSVKNNQSNAELLLSKKDMIKNITNVIKNSKWFHDRYIPCLHLIGRLSDASTEAANEFMIATVSSSLISQIRGSLTIYKKNKSLFDESSKETVEQKMLKYHTLAAEITTLGGLLQADS